MLSRELHHDQRHPATSHKPQATLTNPRLYLSALAFAALTACGGSGEITEAAPAPTVSKLTLEPSQPVGTRYTNADGQEFIVVAQPVPVIADFTDLGQTFPGIWRVTLATAPFANDPSVDPSTIRQSVLWSVDGKNWFILVEVDKDGKLTRAENYGLVDLSVDSTGAPLNHEVRSFRLDPIAGSVDFSIDGRYSPVLSNIRYQNRDTPTLQVATQSTAKQWPQFGNATLITTSKQQAVTLAPQLVIAPAPAPVAPPPAPVCPPGYLPDGMGGCA